MIGGTIKWNLDADAGPLSRSLSAARSEIDSFAKDIKKEGASFSGFLQSAESSSKKFAASLVGVAGAAFGVLSVTTLTAARTETLGVAMNAVAKATGTSKKVLDEQEKVLKKQGITTQESRNTLIKFMQSELDVTKAANLARVAQDLAVISGENSSQTTARLTDAISTMNPMLLRQVGIVKNTEEVFDAYGKTIGKAGKDLTETEKKQALLNLILKEGKKASGAYEDSMTTVGKKLGSMTRLFEEASNSIGEKFLPIFGKAVDFVSDLLKAITPKNIDIFVAKMRRLSGLIPSIVGIIVGGLTPAFVALAVSVGTFIATLAPFFILGAIIGTGVRQLIKHFGGLDSILRSVSRTINPLSYAFSALVNLIKPVLPLLKGLFEGFSTLATVVLAGSAAIAAVGGTIALAGAAFLKAKLFTLALLNPYKQLFKLITTQLVPSLVTLYRTIITKVIPSFVDFSRTLLTKTIPDLLRMIAVTSINFLRAMGQFEIAIVTKGIPALMRFSRTMLTKTIPDLARLTFALGVNAVRGTLAFATALKTQLIPALVMTSKTAILGAISSIVNFGKAAGAGGILGVVGRLSSFLKVGLVGGFVAIKGTVVAAITAVGAFLVSIWPITLAIGTLIAIAGLLFLAWKTNFLGIRDLVGSIVGPVVGFFKSIAAGVDILFNSKGKLKTATDNLKTANEGLIESNKQLKQSQDDLKGAELTLEGAKLRVERSQRTLNETIKEYGPKSLEAREATLDLKQSQHDLTNTQKDLKAKQDNVTDSAKKVTQAQKDLKKATNDQKEAAKNAQDPLRGLKGVFDDITGSIGKAIGKLGDWLSEVGKVKNKGDKKGLFGLGFAGLAGGTSNWGGGSVVVGEKGPELVNLPRGSEVIPNKELKRMKIEFPTQKLETKGGATINQTNYITKETDMEAALRELGWKLSI